MLHLCQHHLHEPRFHDEHHDVGIFHSLHVVGGGVECRVFLLELGKKCLILVCNRNVANLSAFCPSFDERAAHIASANDCKFHKFYDLLIFMRNFAQSYDEASEKSNLFEFFRAKVTCTKRKLRDMAVLT